MFGFSYKTPYHSPTPTAEVTPTVDVVKAPRKDESAYYTIGVTPDGRTQVTFGQDSTMKNTLTMGDGAVAHMIRLLAVNISDSFLVTVTPVTHQPVDDTDPSDLVTDAI
jgi:hypothetical protein